jgi:serine/threonine protein phosphatase 1
MILGQAKTPEGTTIYAIGDIHGRADLLAILLRAIDADISASRPKDRRLVFLGDYCDRGPQSDKALELICARAELGDTVVLRGNHDQAILDFLADPASGGDWWLRSGGRETLAAYGVAASGGDDLFALAGRFRRAMPARHLRLLAGSRLHHAEGDFFFAHAGVRPGVPLASQSPTDLMWIRDAFLGWREPFAKVVVHGHTPVAQADLRPNRINVDTGAFVSGVLTCVVLEGTRYRVLDTSGSLGAARFGW